MIGRDVDKDQIQLVLYTLGDLLFEEVTCFIVGRSKDILAGKAEATKDVDILCDVGNTFSMLHQLGRRSMIDIFYLAKRNELQSFQHGIDIRAYMDRYVPVDLFTSDRVPENASRFEEYGNLIVMVSP